MKTYILADNQDITRAGLTTFLNVNGGNNIIYAEKYADLQQALKLYPGAVVILDYTLFDFSSASQMLNMCMGAKDSSWLLFSDNLSSQFLREVLLSDAAISIITKHSKESEIAQALACVSKGEIYLTEEAKSVLNTKLPESDIPEKLTATEKLILHEIVMGKMTKEIAWERNLSFHTVNTHRRNIFRKLKINNVHEAIKYALRAGISDVSEYCI